MPKERKFYQRKSLGSTRVDLSLKKKKQFIRKIITFGESYKKVSADYKKQTGKWLPRSTFTNWKKTGKDILDSEFTGCTHRKTHKQSEDQERFEAEVLQRIQSSKTDVEALKAKYRTWLMKYRHINQVPSPSLEIGVKQFLALIMGVSQNILSSSWRRTGIPRFQSFEVFPFKNLFLNYF